MKKGFFGILALTLIFGMAVIGCGDGDGNGNGNSNGNGNNGGQDLPTDDGGNGGQNLPAASGVNAVSGKTYFEWNEKIVFSATADGAANGTYTKGRVERDDARNEVLDNNGKYKYIDIETGTYTWNETAKTVTLKPEKVALSKEYGYGALENETAFRESLQTMLDEMKAEMGEAAFNAMANEQLASMGFSSIAAYMNYTVNEAFSNKTNGYSLSTDGTALFLEQALPANKGTNQFSGQTYYGMTWDGDDEKRVKDEDQKYVFTASGYTFTGYGRTETGAYAYDSNIKQVWLKAEKINGKDRQEIHAEQPVWNGHNFADDNAYRAAQTSSQFGLRQNQYNSTNKTIGWEN